MQRKCCNFNKFIIVRISPSPPRKNPQKCGFFLCLCGFSGFLHFALIAYFLRFFASQWHRKSTGKYRKMPPPVMEGVLLRLGLLDEVFIHWVSTLGICLCFLTAAICAGCSILISKEVLLRFVYGVLIHINYTFQTASRADHCDRAALFRKRL